MSGRPDNNKNSEKHHNTAQKNDFFLDMFNNS